MIGRFELAVRVAAALAVTLLPALAFLGLWRLLDVLRDDALIARARAMSGDDSESPSGCSPAPTGAVDLATVCEHCGTSNVSAADYCRECLSELPDR